MFEEMNVILIKIYFIHWNEQNKVPDDTLNHFRRTAQRFDINCFFLICVKIYWYRVKCDGEAEFLKCKYLLNSVMKYLHHLCSLYLIISLVKYYIVLINNIFSKLSIRFIYCTGSQLKWGGLYTFFKIRIIHFNIKVIFSSLTRIDKNQRFFWEYCRKLVYTKGY